MLSPSGRLFSESVLICLDLWPKFLGMNYLQLKFGNTQSNSIKVNQTDLTCFFGADKV
jgi:hypothetical protein